MDDKELTDEELRNEVVNECLIPFTEEFLKKKGYNISLQGQIIDIFAIEKCRKISLVRADIGNQGQMETFKKKLKELVRLTLKHSRKREKALKQHRYIRK